MKLSRDLSLFSVTMIGVGAMIGAGIFVLTGIAAGVAGPAIILAFLLNGIIAFFTASAYAELGSSIPEAGGGYLWVKESLPQPSGFLSGWMSWMAHSVACSLYAVAFGAYLGEILFSLNISVPLSPEILKKLLAVVIVIVFSFINYRGAKETGRAGNVITIFKILILLLFVVLGLGVIIKEPVRFGQFVPFFPKGYMGILTAMGLTYIAFEGYEIIAQSGEEIIEPKRNIPRAIFYSLIIVVPIYIVVAFVALGVVNPGHFTAWDFLALKKETAMVEAARHISRWGSAMLLAGGLLSTISALNATIYSSSRVAFAMGRDHNLPEIFSRVHRRFKTPSGALFASSSLIMLMSILLPIEDIASSADIMFLFLFIFVNIALIHIRRRESRRLTGYRSPFFPLFPVMGIITQTILVIVMFAYSPKSFFMSLAWIAAGLSIYYGYSRLKEREVVGPQVIVEEKELVYKDYRLVLGIEDEKEAGPLMKVAAALAGENDGEIFLSHIITLPPQTPLRAGKRFIEGRKKLFDLPEKLGKKENIPVSFNIRASHRVYLGLLDSVREYKANVLILGSGEIKRRGKIPGRVLDPILQEAPCDVGIMKISNGDKMKRILVPTAGGPNAKLAFQWAAWIAKKNKGKLTLFYVVPDEAKVDTAVEILNDVKDGADYEEKRVTDKIVAAKDPLKAIFDEAQNHDLILVGTTRKGLWERIRFGTIPKKLFHSSPISVLVVERYQGKVISWLRRFIAG